MVGGHRVPRAGGYGVAAALTCVVAATEQAPPQLFRAPDGPVSATEPADPAAVRSRWVEVDFDLLSSPQEGQRLAFNLLDDVSFVGVLEREGPARSDGHAWSGRIENQPGGTFTLVTRPGVVAAMISVPGTGTYRVRPRGVVHIVQEIDESQLPPCGNGPEHAVAGGAPAAGGPPCDDGSVIDVLVVYTTLARLAAGGTAAIEAELDLAVAMANEAYDNSLVATQINLVHTEEISYNEDGTYSQHLIRLTLPNDGIMDQVHDLRDEHMADMVGLLVDDGEFCGQAWLMLDLSPDFEDSAFSVTTWYCAASLVLAHELGHNMGCCHARGDGGGCGPGLFPYSHGHRFYGDTNIQWRTVMAYSPGSRIRYFSNPNVSYDGQPVGVPAEDPLYTDNALTINQTKLIISQFRCSIPPCQVGKLSASDADAGDSFGRSVAISGDLAVVGAGGDDDNGSSSGSAYGYGFDSETGVWEEQPKIMPSDGAEDSRFGQAVALSGDAAVIGAYQDDEKGSDAGAAYVFRFVPNAGTWDEQQKLLASDPEAGDSFGRAVAIDGDVAVVGAEAEDERGSAAGAAYVYRFDPDTAGWGEQAKLLASDGAADDGFGESVAVHGEVAIVGASGDDDQGAESGSAYVYRFDPGTSQWDGEAKLLASDGEADDRFGLSVAIFGDMVMVGAYHDDDNGDNAGAVYVYQYNPETSAWDETAKLLPSDGTEGSFFGRAVAMSDTVAVVGAYGVDDSGVEAGSAYVYRRIGSVWYEEAKLLASDPGDGDRFGFGVSVSGDRVLAGAFTDDDAGPGSGSAEIFAGPLGFDCNANGVSDICDIDYGTSLDENGNGIPDECDCPWDLDDSGEVGTGDLLALLWAWDTNPGGPPDFDGNGRVDSADFHTLMGNWGPCP